MVLTIKRFWSLISVLSFTKKYPESDKIPSNGSCILMWLRLELGQCVMLHIFEQIPRSSIFLVAEATTKTGTTTSSLIRCFFGTSSNVRFSLRRLGPAPAAAHLCQATPQRHNPRKELFEFSDLVHFAGDCSSCCDSLGCYSPHSWPGTRSWDGCSRHSWLATRRLAGLTLFEDLCLVLDLELPSCLSQDLECSLCCQLCLHWCSEFGC